MGGRSGAQVNSRARAERQDQTKHERTDKETYEEVLGRCRARDGDVQVERKNASIK